MRPKTDFANVKCCKCGEGDLTSKTAIREYENEARTKRWICKQCYETYQRYKSYEKPDKKYNETNTCDNTKDDGTKCREKLIPKNAYKEKDKNENWTGRWLCKKCYSLNYDRKRDRKKEYRERYISDRRSRNLNQDTNSGKGDLCQILTCKWRGIKDLNVEDDNYNSPIDHSRDHELGIVQTECATYSSIYRYWHQNWEREHNKEFDYLIFYCINKEGKIIERIYIFPKEEIIKRKSVGIYKYSMKGWYEKYRVKDENMLRKVNEIFQELIES